MKKYIGLSIIALSLGLTSCNSYLDKLPDNRMELSTPEDIKNLMVSAYPTTYPAYLLEMYSDNADECINTGWNEADRFQRQAFHWDDITEISANESPQTLWNSYYSAIAACNASIQFIESQSPTEQAAYAAQLGEALVCRAYCMFVMSTVFCQAYSPEHASSDLGLPYPTATEVKVGETYERGTLAELYEKIDADLQRGLPLVTNEYSKPKFHFTADAANAFAARFYLNYCKFDKTIEYANKVLGDYPMTKLRDWDYYNSLNANGMIQPEAFVAANEGANLLLQTVYSQWGAINGPSHLGDRYAHGNRIANDETIACPGPWGATRGSDTDGFKYTLWYNDALAKYMFRKIPYEFEYIDLQAGIGYPHAEYAVFTTDILLLERAEAYALQGNLEAAVKDINTEILVFHKRPTMLTVEDIANFYNSIEYYQPTAATPKKQLHPVFTTIGADGSDQECVLQCLLHLRRILTMHEGFRMQDVKRYGITIYRRTMNSAYQITNVSDKMEARDPRQAIQLPQDVMSAGMDPNPRTLNVPQTEEYVTQEWPVDNK